MEREIKFRVWCETDDGEEMIYLDTLTCDNGLWFGYQEKHINEHIDIMQYAGGKDLNQKEVYEGDIFIGYEERDGKRLSGKFIVEWEDHAFIAKSIEENGCDAWLSFFFSNENTVPQTAIEVIGNIHQHPELLKPTSESNTLPK